MTGRKNQDEEKKGGGGQPVGFTAVEGVPGVRLQHVRAVLRGAASPPQAPGPSLRGEAAVTGHGLGDVVHAVHLQIRLV